MGGTVTPRLPQLAECISAGVPSGTAESSDRGGRSWVGPARFVLAGGSGQVVVVRGPQDDATYLGDLAREYARVGPELRTQVVVLGVRESGLPGCSLLVRQTDPDTGQPCSAWISGWPRSELRRFLRQVATARAERMSA